MTLARRRLAAASLTLFAAATLAGCPAPAPSTAADLVLLGGRVVPVDPDVPEGTALAIRDGRILAVGSDADADRWIGDGTRVIGLDGRLAIPGFVEAHGHFMGLGRESLRLDLRAARTWDAVVEQVRAAALEAPEGAWILGRGWHQEKWDAPPREHVDGFPVRTSLDAATPSNPVFLVHASGHAAIVNEAALRRAGIDAATPDPPGGRIDRDAAGRPTGVLHESAGDPVQRAIDEDRSALDPGDRRRQTERIVEAAARACAEHGVTSFQDAGATIGDLEVFDALAAAGRLDVRLWVMLGEPDAVLADRLDALRRVGAHDGLLTVRAIKRYADGALGNRGAWLLEPYADMPGTDGIPTTPVPDLEATARLALEHDFQLCVHAIGDRANREVLDVYERAFADAPPGDRRWRIEHAQHVTPDDVPRFAELGVIASMQGIHCASDSPWVEQRIGAERAATGAYVWRDLVDAGAVLANGTDVPVEPIDPIANFHALVTRTSRDGAPFHVEQRLTRAEALRAATLDAAYAAFEEDVKGSLTPGKVADVVVLSHDLLALPEDRIPETKVWMTVLGGRIVHGGPERKEAP